MLPNGPVCRRKNGRFVKKTWYNWLDNVTKSNKQRHSNVTADQSLEMDINGNANSVGLGTDTDSDFRCSTQTQEGNELSTPGLTTSDSSDIISVKPTKQKGILKWDDGRRIVELSTLAKHMVCSDCGKLLSLSHIADETRIGYASILYVTCDCGVINSVPTSKSHFVENSKRRKVYDVNTKVSAGMLDAGMGPTHVDAMMAAINIPVASSGLIKRREREIGPAIESVATESCEEALQEETNHSVDIVGSYDMGWQRRSTGRAYNSMSGHASLIGYNTRKIISWGTRKTTCRICEVAAEKNKEPKQHDCRRNWKGSSKSMEASVALEVLQEVQNISGNKALVNTLIMDDDATTLSHVKRFYNPDIDKWNDINHAKKSLSNALYALQKKHKALTYKVIQYFNKMYGYALTQNKGKESELRNCLLTIAPHAFGNHSNCGKWCKYLENRDNYKHRNFPRGEPLQGDEFFQDISGLFVLHSYNAKKLIHLGSTQANESFNQQVASKAPKSRHYAGSESLDYRVGASVCQKNHGRGYLTTAMEKVNLSPSMVLTIKAQRLDNKALKRKTVSTTPGFKKRRRELKENRNSARMSIELREGSTYETGVSNSTKADDIDEIPPPKTQPKLDHLKKETNYSYVYFDLETTDISMEAAICQISAVGPDDYTFNVYILPGKPINRAASQVTHLTVHGDVLLYRGKPVPTSTLTQALQNFIQFLKKYEHVVLIGHNAKCFDTFHLLRAMSATQLESHLEVDGFVDTLPYFRAEYPGRKTYKQESLVQDLLGTSYQAHNALDDCIALKKVVQVTPSHSLVEYGYSVKWAWSYMKYRCERKITLGSYHKILSEKGITGGMAIKAAGSGLAFNHLTLAFRRSGREGLTALLGENVEGRPRVTRSKGVIDKLCKYLETIK